MIRLVSIAAAFATSAALLGATASHAQSPTGYYVAVPAAAPTKASLITRSTPWSLHDGSYVANKAPERDGVLCELVVKSVGKLNSFTVAGKAYDAPALDKCNSKAK
ncbi:conserved exported hypothetical protein [Sphingomonas sp. EC-HK361]|jgi:hypothetical protein|uniref:CC_3452 family protein n=1 Tax=Sphingomonas sp. EC-HK361 TaxID=2038397 RepID=UPI0012531BE4|nr:hypothetical protein [Sphingomonas sp. EC-HK361]VVS98512.1 conserved exported hypothetical protein [Sphingomonas sp. EC-HK361]